MTDKIEETKRDMYQHLASVKDTMSKGFSPRNSIRKFEDAMEAHLEALRLEIADLSQVRRVILQESTEYQERMHALDRAYLKSQEALGVAGEELRDAQHKAKYWEGQCGVHVTHRDELQRKVRTLQAKTEAQHAVIVSQREGYGQLFMENAALTKRLTSAVGDSVKVEATPRVEVSAPYIDPYDGCLCMRFMAAYSVDSTDKCFKCGQPL